METEKILQVAKRSYGIAVERYMMAAEMDDSHGMTDGLARSSAISELIQDLGIMSRDEFKEYLGG